MFCPYCGTSLDDDAQSCTACNSPVSPLNESNTPKTADQPEVIEETIAPVPQKKRSKHTGTILTISCIVVALAVVVALAIYLLPMLAGKGPATALYIKDNELFTTRLAKLQPWQVTNKLIDAINKMLEYDKNIKIMIETKPNEPIDRSVCPTLGHCMAVSAATKDPSRVGGLLESAHAMLAALDPASEIGFASAMGKLWGVHLNDQNGMKFDQDKSFGVENLRTAFNQIKVLMENNFGANGEYIGLDVKAMRTERQEGSYRHLENSLKIAKMLEAKAEKFD